MKLKKSEKQRKNLKLEEAFMENLYSNCVEDE